MKVPAVNELKVFVPARDFAVSRAFYLDLGGHLNWEVEGMSEFAFGGTRFLLQDFYVRDWAENFVMHFRVDDADAWYAHMRGLVEAGRYPGIRVREPRDEPWGDRITYAWDPSGVLLHFAQASRGA